MQSQFNHKQPTRFNDPEIPQDLATKGYVDSTVVTTNIQQFNQNAQDTAIGVAREFMGYGSIMTGSVTESARGNVAMMPITYEKHQINITLNGQAGTSNFILRIDGSDIRTLFAIAAAATGIFTIEVEDSILEDILFAYAIDKFDAGTLTIRAFNARARIG